MAAAAGGCRGAAGGRAPRAWDGQEKEVGHDGPGSKTRDRSHPGAAASLRREGNTRLEEKAVIREIPLQDTATLETELSALQRRQLRLAPEMDRCGEPLY